MTAPFTPEDVEIAARAVERASSGFFPPAATDLLTRAALDATAPGIAAKAAERALAPFVELARDHDSGRGKCVCELCKAVRAARYSTVGERPFQARRKSEGETR